MKIRPSRIKTFFACFVLVFSMLGIPISADPDGVSYTLNMGSQTRRTTLSVGIKALEREPPRAGSRSTSDTGMVSSLDLLSEEIALLAQVGGATQAVAVQEDYAYVGVGPRLVIVDVSTPTAPQAIGQTSVFPEPVRAIEVMGSLAYVGAGDLYVVDISNPVSPALIASCEIPDSAPAAIVVSGDIAYVAADYGGLRILDVSDPTNLKEVGSYSSPGLFALDVYVSGDVAYVAAWDQGLLVVDISNHAQPAEIGQYIDSPGAACGIYVNGDIAYLAFFGGGLRVLDVSDPATPTDLGAYQPDRILVSSVYVSGGTAYVGYDDDLSGGLLTVDVSNSAQPTELGFYDVPRQVMEIYVTEDTAYVADVYAGLHILDTENPAEVSPLSLYETPLADSSGLYVGEEMAYIADGSSGRLSIFDVSSTSNPIWLSKHDMAGSYPRDVEVSGAVAYIAGGFPDGGLRMVDVNNLEHPVGLSTYSGEGSGTDISVRSGFAYLGGSTGVHVLDVSNPLEPAEITQFGTGMLMDMHLGDHIIYFVECIEPSWECRLGRIDVSDPSSPSWLGYFDLPWQSETVHASGDTVYISTNTDGLRVVDFTDPAVPTEISVYKPPGYHAGAVFASGNRLYAAVSGLRVLDITDPSAPVEVGSHYVELEDVHVSNDMIYGIGRSTGLHILRALNSGETFSVSGQVLDDWGSPIMGVEITDGAGHIAISDDTGRYLLEGLTAGISTLVPSKYGYSFSPSIRTVTVPLDSAGQDFTAHPMFVYTSGIEFMLGNESFYFGGTNNYYVSNTSEEVVDRILHYADEMNLRVIRVWGFNDPDNVGNLDYLLEQAGKKGLGLIIVLTNNWNDFPTSDREMDDYVVRHWQIYHHDFYTDSDIIADYLGWVEDVILRRNSLTHIRYRDDPTIFAWELANEPRCEGNDLPSLDHACDPTVIKDWVAEVAAYVKYVDPNHLVGVGDEGFLRVPGAVDAEYNGSLGDFEALLHIDSIDYGTFHLYPERWGKAVSLDPSLDWGSQWIYHHIITAHSIGKPVILEEFGITDALLRDSIYDLWTSSLHRNGGNGFLFWMLADDSQDPSLDDGLWIYYPSETATTLSDAARGMAQTMVMATGTSIMEDVVHLQQGETEILLADVPADQTIADFAVTWPGSRVDVSLIDPGGRVITESVAISDPTIEHFEGSTLEFYRLKAPLLGVWQIELYGADLAGDGEEVTVKVVGHRWSSIYLPIIMRSR